MTQLEIIKQFKITIEEFDLLPLGPTFRSGEEPSYAKSQVEKLMKEYKPIFRKNRNKKLILIYLPIIVSLIMFLISMWFKS